MGGNAGRIDQRAIAADRPPNQWAMARLRCFASIAAPTRNRNSWRGWSGRWSRTCCCSAQHFRAMRRADAVLFTGSPPLMVHFIAPLNLLLRKQLIYRITDFHPECLIAERGSSGSILASAAASHAVLATSY